MQCVSAACGDGGTAVRMSRVGVLGKERGGLGQGYRVEALGDLPSIDIKPWLFKGPWIWRHAEIPCTPLMIKANPGFIDLCSESLGRLEMM